MSSTLATRLSRALVSCYPRRWRQRYGDEVLDVLDQHRSGARTVLNLAASALSTRLDPSYRAERPAMTGWRRVALMTSIVAGAWVLAAFPVGLYAHAQFENDNHWHIGIEGGVNAMAFSPAQPDILVTATSGAPDGLDTLWNVANPAHARKLADFEGGAPAAFAPDGRTVVTVSFHDQPALWDVTDLSAPRRITTLASADRNLLWGEAFSPDGRVLAVAYTKRSPSSRASAHRRPRRPAITPSCGT